MPVDASSVLLRLIAALVVREDSLPDAAAKLITLGLDPDDIAPVVKTLARSSLEGVSQRETIERLVDLGFSAATIAQVTEYPKTSVASVVSRYKSRPVSVPESIEG